MTLTQKKNKPALRCNSKRITNTLDSQEIHSTQKISKKMGEPYPETEPDTTEPFNQVLGQQLIQQAINASPCANEIVIEAEAVSAALSEMQPQDAAEGMLITQIVSLHNQMMYYMKRSIEDQWETEECLGRFLKINRQFLACLHGLLKYRNREQQSVVFQNVNVGSDGKAIVGCIQSPPK